MRGAVTRYRLSEASRKIGVGEEFIVRCIHEHWIVPAAPEEPALDEEDLARARLIHELMDDLGANAESVPIILHLLDQLYLLRAGRAA
jgi:hypothetical protein